MSSRQHSPVKGIARLIPSLALGLVSLLAAGEAKAGSFTFSTIAENTSGWGQGQFNSFGLGLGTAGGWSGYNLGFDANQYGISLSNSGRAAFLVNKKDGSQAIYTSLGTPFSLKDIADTTTNGGYQSFGQGISITNPVAGKEYVGFFGVKNGQSGIYETQSGQVGGGTNIVNTNGILSSFAPGLSINDSQTVAFLANLDSGGQEIFKSNGNPTTPTYITHCTTSSGIDCPVNGSGSYEPSINNDGTVAFVSGNGVFTGDGSGQNSIIVSDPNSFLNGSYREANINNSGWVSAFAHNVGPGQIIFSSDGNDGSIIVGNDVSPSNGGDFWYLGTSSINNSGNVAFEARQAGKGTRSITDKTGVGIFTGFDSVADKVVAVGDYLKNAAGQNIVDSQIVDLSFDRQSLNDSGEIAFWAKFANGTEGIYRANPFGESQFNPWMPNCPINNGSIYSFCDVRSHQWYDPPTANGFDYKMDGDSLFTSILDLPSTFENPFTVSVGGIVLGQFTNGDEIDFSKYADLLGNLLIGGSGVKEFSVRTSDTIDPSNPLALPIKLAFNTETANFSLFALDPVDNSNVEKVPEPATMMGLLSIGAFFVYSGQRRKQKKA